MYRIASDVELVLLRISAGSIAVGLHALALGLMLMPSAPLQPSVIARPQDLVVGFRGRRSWLKPEPVPPVPTPPRLVSPNPAAHRWPRRCRCNWPTPRRPVPSLLAAPEFDAPGPVEQRHHPAARGTHRHPSRAHARPTQASRDAVAGGHGAAAGAGGRDGRPTRCFLLNAAAATAASTSSASEHVLARWRFQPAVVEGRAVSAWARVPIVFDLRAG